MNTVNAVDTVAWIKENEQEGNQVLRFEQKVEDVAKALSTMSLRELAAVCHRLSERLEADDVNITIVGLPLDEVKALGGIHKNWKGYEWYAATASISTMGHYGQVQKVTTHVEEGKLK